MKKTILLLFLVSFCFAGIMPKEYDEFLEWKPIKYGVVENVHLPEHMAGAIILAYGAKKLNFDPVHSKNIFRIAAGTIELWQFVDMQGDPPRVYGSWEKWVYDTAGDYFLEVWAYNWTIDSEPLVPDGFWRDLWGKITGRKWTLEKTPALGYNPYKRQFELILEF